MPDQGQVGLQYASDGQPANLRQTTEAALVMQQLHGNYQELARRGFVFTAITTTAVPVAISGIGSAAQNPVLWNPPTSGKTVIPLFLNLTPVYAAVATVANYPTAGLCLGQVTNATAGINASYLSALVNAAPSELSVASCIFCWAYCKRYASSSMALS